LRHRPLAFGCAIVLFVVPLQAGADPVLEGLDATVMLEAASTAANQTLVASGVIVRRENGLAILTVAHAFRSGYAARVTLADGERLELRSVERVADHDLAIVTTRGLAPRVRPAPVGVPSLEHPNLFIWGHPGGRPFQLLHATLVALDAPMAGRPGTFTVRCADCVAGCSGAGVFDDRGVLLGVLSQVEIDEHGTRSGLAVVEPATLGTTVNIAR
jgi:hypothetical protein